MTRFDSDISQGMRNTFSYSHPTWLAVADAKRGRKELSVSVTEVRELYLVVLLWFI